MSTLGTPGCALSATSFTSSCLARIKHVFFQRCFEKMTRPGIYQVLQDQGDDGLHFQKDDVSVLLGSSNLVCPKAPETI